MGMDAPVKLSEADGVSGNEKARQSRTSNHRYIRAFNPCTQD